jgi:hypothetical protein
LVLLLMTALICMDGEWGKREKVISDFGFTHVVNSEENENTF